MPTKAKKVQSLIDNLRERSVKFEHCSMVVKKLLQKDDHLSALLVLKERASLVLTLTELCSHPALPSLSKEVEEVLKAELKHAADLAEATILGGDMKALILLHHKHGNQKNGFEVLADKIEMYLLPGPK